MGLRAAEDAESRFVAFVDGVGSVIGHADRAGPLRDYCTGLVMPCERKSVEPMAAVTAPANVSRFENPRQLMAYLGLTPSERSTGESVKRGGITKAGNTRGRRLLIEAAWSYRFPPRVSKDMQTRIGAAPRTAREIAWKAQTRR
jgi:Transposase IS116/IS110/IS902 family